MQDPNWKEYLINFKDLPIHIIKDFKHMGSGTKAVKFIWILRKPEYFTPIRRLIVSF